jgi:hypothetical protein
MKIQRNAASKRKITERLHVSITAAAVMAFILMVVG